MIDDKLEREEIERSANYEAIKATVKGEVGSEIAAEAQSATPRDAARIDNLAGHMRAKAVDEVITEEQEIERSRMLARVSQVVDYIFFVIYALLVVRLLLALMAARSEAGFVQFIRAISDPFYAPFRGIVASPTTPEGYTLAFPIIVALVVYVLLHMAINGLLRIFVHRKTEV